MDEGGGRWFSVGATLVRVSDTGASGTEACKVGACEVCTRIFLLPPRRPRVVDGLLTNFHLPQSTLLMLVSTLSTLEIMLQTCKKAVEEKYRFFSFGDGMFITDLNK